MSKEAKNGILLGGLTSTLGLFVTKAIGILYVAPFRAIASPENYVYYAAGYELYDLMLTISLAGLPFAIAAIVSKYMEKEDYKSVMVVKKISQSMLGVFGFICATVVVIFINQFVGTRGNVSIEQATIYRNVYLIMTLSIFTVPLLSSYRGFFQGIKDYKSYSTSQVIEQIARVSFLLGVGFLCVYILKTDRIYAVYAALFATAFSAVIAILHLSVFKKDRIQAVADLAEQQEGEALPVAMLMKELIFFAIPYLISVVLSSRFGFSNMIQLPSALQSYGYDVSTTQIYTSLITNETLKLIGIPTVLATGFAVAVIPEMSQALVRHDYKTIQKNVRISIESVLYIGLPVLCCMYFLSEEIYYILFGGSEAIVSMGGEVTKVHVIYGVLSLLTPVIAALTMTLDLRRDTLVILGISFVLNFILLPLFVKQFGWSGALWANCVTSILSIGASLVLVKRKYQVDFKFTIRKILLMFVSLISMALVYKILRLIGLPVISLGKFKGLITLGIYGVCMLIPYLVVSNYLYLPQSILGVDFKLMLRKVLNK